MYPLSWKCSPTELGTIVAYSMTRWGCVFLSWWGSQVEENWPHKSLLSSLELTLGFNHQSTAAAAAAVQKAAPGAFWTYHPSYCLLCWPALSLEICEQKHGKQWLRCKNKHPAGALQTVYYTGSIKWVCKRYRMLLALPTPNLNHLYHTSKHPFRRKGTSSNIASNNGGWTSSSRVASRDCARDNELEVG